MEFRFSVWTRTVFGISASLLISLGALSQTVTTNGGTTNTVPKFSSSTQIINSAISENNGTVDVNGSITTTLERSLLLGTVNYINNSTPAGSSIGSTAGENGNFNSFYFNQNGTVDGDSNPGAQINTALPSWRMTLGSGASEWGGGDTFAIGRVAPGGTYSTPSIFVKVSNGGTMTVPFQRSLLLGTVNDINSSPTGSTIGSTSGQNSNFNSFYFNQNGTVDGDGNSGAQINTSLPSWRMTLGSGASEWGGGDTFAIGRVAAGGTYTSPTVVLKIDNSGLLHTSGGIVFPDGSEQTTANLTQPFSVCVSNSTSPLSCSSICNTGVLSQATPPLGGSCSTSGTTSSCSGTATSGTNAACCVCK